MPSLRCGLALLPVLALTACGGGGGKPTVTQAKPPVSGKVDVPPAPADDAKSLLQRLEGAATAPSCDAVRGVLHSYYGTITDLACRAIQAQLAGFHGAQATTHGLGALVTYKDANDQLHTAVLALDADRRYRLVYIDDGDGTAANPGPTFAATASGVIAALRDGDCNALLRDLDRRIGLGVGQDREVCRNVGASLLRREILGTSAARPRALGGNGRVAFFELRSAPGRYYTLVLRRPAAGGSTATPRVVLVNAIPAD
jgi:hypothetical protein